MSFSSLLNSTVQVERLVLDSANGRASMVWYPQPPPLDWVRCRLDLNFLRPGKDIPMPVAAGKAPDRIGVMFCPAGTPIKAGDRIRTIPNVYGDMPVVGVFEIRTIPDPVLGYSTVHHIESQIVEVSQLSPPNSQRDFSGVEQ